MKKRLITYLTAVFAIISCVTCYARFGDVLQSHWAYPSIQKMNDQKMIDGFPDGSFRPDNSVSRAEFSKMFTTVFGFESHSADEYANVLEYLPDAEYAAWYYPYICAALPCMFTSESGFNPDGEMSREDAAHSLAVLYGYVEMNDNTIVLSDSSMSAALNFTDAEYISEGKKNSVAAAVQNGFMEGKGEGIFDPKGPLTRAEICVLFMRTLDEKGAPPKERINLLQGKEYKIVYEPKVVESVDLPQDNNADSSYSPSDTPTASDAVTEAEHKVWELVNKERAAAGLPALKYDENLAAVARAHSIDMDNRNFFDHVNPDGKTPFDRMKEAGFNYSYAAENIAWNQRSPEEVMKSWMNSSGHRKNILNENVTYLGVGLHIANDGSHYWTQAFFKPLR